MKQFLKNFRALRLLKSSKKKMLNCEEPKSKLHEAAITHFSDSIYFAGLSDEGVSLVTRMSFRNKKLNENWLKVYIPGEGVWGFENRGMIEADGFRQGQLEYRCEEPGKTWRIIFQGQLFQGTKYYQISLDLVWKSTLPLIDFQENGIPLDQTAFQIAGQDWSRGFAKQLKTLRRQHYEQAGEMKGTITWKRIKQRVELKAIRTRSIGQLNWKDWGRHFWFTGLLEDGRMLHTGIADYNFVSKLRSGFASDGEKIITLVKTPMFEELNFDKDSAKSLSFALREKAGEEEKPVRVEMAENFTFKMDDVYAIRQAKAIFEYDGAKGIGIVEMGLKLKEHEKQEE